MPDHGDDADAQAAAGGARAWDIYVASAIGADHVRAGNPNQDAVATERFELPGSDSLLVFAVADGHGHARHFRSDRGSRLAVAAGISMAKDWATAIPAGTAVSHPAASQLVTDVVQRWQQEVAADLASEPITQAPSAALYPDDPPEIAYGSTLLLALIRGDAAVLAQIGDGEMLLVRPDGGVLTPVPSDRRLDGTQTTSLCQPDAVSAFRIALVNLAKTPIFGIFAATDGYGNAQADENWRPRLAADLAALSAKHGTNWLGEQLTGWNTLCASSQGSGDDSTVALALNTSVAPKPAAWLGRQRPTSRLDAVTLRLPEPMVSSEQLPDEPAGQPPYGGSARRHVLTTAGRRSLAGVVVLALIVAVFLLLRSHGQSRGVGPTISPTVSPTVSHTAIPTPSPGVSHTRSKASPRPSRTASQKIPAIPVPTSAVPSIPVPAAQPLSEKWSRND